MTSLSLERPLPCLITIEDVEHPRATGRRIRTGLTLVGAGVTAILALAAGSPSAVADPSTVVLPVIPTFSGGEIDPQSLGIAPFFSGEAFEQNGTFTNLLGESIDTTASYYAGGPMQVDIYQFPGSNPGLLAEQVSDPGGAYGVESASINGTVESSTFSLLAAPSAGLYDLYEETPFDATNATSFTENINEAIFYDPTVATDHDFSGIEFGIQYIDTPDSFANGVLTPIDEINVLGAGGEIIASIPVTGDLSALF